MNYKNTRLIVSKIEGIANTEFLSQEIWLRKDELNSFFSFKKIYDPEIDGIEVHLTTGNVPEINNFSLVWSTEIYNSTEDDLSKLLKKKEKQGYRCVSILL